MCAILYSRHVHFVYIITSSTALQWNLTVAMVPTSPTYTINVLRDLAGAGFWCDSKLRNIWSFAIVITVQQSKGKTKKEKNERIQVSDKVLYHVSVNKHSHFIGSKEQTEEYYKREVKLLVREIRWCIASLNTCGRPCKISWIIDSMLKTLISMQRILAQTWNPWQCGCSSCFMLKYSWFSRRGLGRIQPTHLAVPCQYISEYLHFFLECTGSSMQIWYS